MSIKLQSQMIQTMEAENEIYVKGFTKGTDEKALLSFFTTGFGKVESVDILKDVECQAIIRFQRIEAMKTAMQSSNKLFLQGSKLTITARRPLVSDRGSNKKVLLYINKGTPGSNTKKTIAPSSAVTKVVAGLHLVGSFENQLRIACRQILLNEQEYSKLLMVARVLEDVLQETFPGCKVLCFGSAISGLAFKGSDLDCFVRLPEHLKNRICYGRSSEEAQRNLVNRTKKRLYNFKNIFSNVTSIPSARIPIVKFIHRPTRHNCDVSFKNLFGISNTFLIKSLLTTDQRLFPLFTFIKYWGKTHDIIANGKMTSYSFILLIIFYLQQLDKPIIPALMRLQRDRAFDIYEEGWNCGFNLTQNNFPQTRNESSLSTLVLGFFHYYSEYNFETQVICTLTGESIEKSKFNDAATLPPELSNYVVNLNSQSTETFPSAKCMCVQDPIVLSTNTTRGVSANLLKFFQAHCDLAVDNISAGLDENNGESLMSKLLSQEIAPVKQKASKQSASIKLPDTIITQLARKAAGVDPSSRQDITNTGMRDDINRPLSNGILIELCNSVAKILIDIFENVLKCSFQGNVNSFPMPNTVPNICFQCTVIHNVWDLRNDVDKSVLPGKLFLADEALISEIMIGQSSTGEKTEPLLQFSINMRPINNGKMFVLNMKSKNCQANVLFLFFKFFQSTLTTAFQHHLKLSD